ncbi:MAG: hypothetical protein ABIZ80_18375 [Bryobacteraceae bacterium]
MNRRELLAGLIPLAANAALPPVRPITKGPAYHWFGYYDKRQFDPTSRYALGVENTFQHRLPTKDDFLKFGMVDTASGDRWIELGESRSWSWHQTCMLQWLPGSPDEVIWNNRVDGKLVSQVVNVKTRQKRMLPKPIYCLAPDARFALVNDFARSFTMRPETGYAGVPDPNVGDLAPANSGVWRMDMATGKHDLIISLADVVKIPLTQGDWKGAKHYFDHLLIAPGGKHFIFFQRWGMGPGMGFKTRMFVAGVDGKNPRVLDDSGQSSHYIWHGSNEVLIWTAHPSHQENFYLVDIATGKFKLYSKQMNKNGHISFLPGNRWLVGDRKVQGKWEQYLYDTSADRIVSLGTFADPPEYKGYWRCDTTPRFSPDSHKIVFDSPQAGNGRQMYLIDISGIVK